MSNMKPIRVLVVDDEEPARQYLEELILRDRRFQVVGMASDGRQAVDQVQRLQPDVVFIDIEMPHLTGLEVCTQSDQTNSKFVFVSAFPEYALQAFECEALDYVVKPIQPERFARTLSRVVSNVASTRRVNPDSNELQNSQLNRPGGSMNRNVLQTVRGKLLFHSDEIDFLESSGNYVKVWIDGNCHLSRGTLTEFMANYGVEHLVSVHRSFVVNIAKIKKFIRDPRNGCGELLLDDECTRVPVSRSRRLELERILDELYAVKRPEADAGQEP